MERSEAESVVFQNVNLCYNSSFSVVDAGNDVLKHLFMTPLKINWIQLEFAYAREKVSGLHPANCMKISNKAPTK